MKQVAIGLGVVAILCSSSVFAGLGTIRFNIEGGYGGAPFASAKCWANGRSTTGWDTVLVGQHKTCHGAEYMRVDYKGVPPFEGTRWTERYYRGSGVTYPGHHFSHCRDDQTLRITAKASDRDQASSIRCD